MRRNFRIFASRVMPLLAGGWTLAPLAHADDIRPPPVPADIQVDPGVTPFLVGHGVGTQNYVCLPSGAGFAGSIFTPEATLFANGEKQLTTHFFGPNPDEDDVVRAAWQHSRDTSTVWARAVKASSDPTFVAQDAIPWVKLEVKGRRVGPDGGDALTPATFIQRVNTAGGAAPATGCAVATDVGAKAFVPYEADYFFFTGPPQ
jgi:hypothetical protein